MRVEGKEWFNILKNHLGHEIELVSYGKGQNVAIECLDCQTVIVDCDNPN